MKMKIQKLYKPLRQLRVIESRGDFKVIKTIPRCRIWHIQQFIIHCLSLHTHNTSHKGGGDRANMHTIPLKHAYYPIREVSEFSQLFDRLVMGPIG